MSKDDIRDDDATPTPAPKFEIPDEVDDLEAVPEVIRELYAEENGKYKRRDLKKVLATMQHAKANEKEAKAEAAKLRKLVEQVKDVDAEEYARLKAEHEKRQIDEAERKGEYEKIIAKKEAVHREDMEKAKAENEGLRQSLKDHIVSTEITKWLVAYEANDDGLEFLPERLSRQMELVEEDGKRTIRAIGSDGMPRLNSNGEYMNGEDLVKEAREKHGSLFKGSRATGGGAPASNGTGSSAPALSQKTSEMTVEQKAAYIAEHGLKAWKERF